MLNLLSSICRSASVNVSALAGRMIEMLPNIITETTKMRSELYKYLIEFFHGINPPMTFAQRYTFFQFDSSKSIQSTMFYYKGINSIFQWVFWYQMKFIAGYRTQNVE